MHSTGLIAVEFMQKTSQCQSKMHIAKSMDLWINIGKTLEKCKAFERSTSNKVLINNKFHRNREKKKLIVAWF